MHPDFVQGNSYRALLMVENRSWVRSCLRILAGLGWEKPQISLLQEPPLLAQWRTCPEPCRPFLFFSSDISRRYYCCLFWLKTDPPYQCRMSGMFWHHLPSLVARPKAQGHKGFIIAGIEQASGEGLNSTTSVETCTYGKTAGAKLANYLQYPQVLLGCQVRPKSWSIGSENPPVRKYLLLSYRGSDLNAYVDVE